MQAQNTLSDMIADWDGFERLIAQLHETGSVKVEHNVTLTGKSSAPRQIDVLVRHKEGLYEHLIVVECKYRNAAIERLHIDALATTIREVGASRGVIFSTKGFQRGAITQAKNENISLFKIRELTDEEWGSPGRHFDLWLHINCISIGDFKAPGSLLAGPPPKGRLEFFLDNSTQARSSKTPLKIPGQPETTLEQLLIKTALQSARHIYIPQIIDFGKREEGEIRRKVKVKIQPERAAEVSTMSTTLIFPEMEFLLGLKISQSRFQRDRHQDYTFVLAVEDCITKSVKTASRKISEKITVLEDFKQQPKSENIYQNGSICSIWPEGILPFEEFENVPIADGPGTQLTISSLADFE
ncbi:restriction endonuclease [Parasphingorhabdus sp.]|uniref:restriction endonuclease n=1 Tax=Parasphingorhabdus sp. TaxID=2709688 RepID=UPI003D2904CF